MSILADVRFALRALRRHPVVAATSIGSLAIGIAASATIFALADALFLRPRPGLVDEERLVDVGRATDGEGFDNFGYQLLLALRGARQLEGLAGYRLDPSPVSLEDGSGGSERAYATPVTANYFAVLGTRAAAGRLFSGNEDLVPDGAPVAVLSHAFWQRRFGGDSAAVGTTLRVNGRAYTVVGVAEPGFQGTTIAGADLWVPFSMAPHVTGRRSLELLTEHGPVWHLGVARLKDGVSLEQAQTELNSLLTPLSAAVPDAYRRWSIALLPSARVPGELRMPVRGFVALLFGLTGIVLAIACSNVAGVLLARGLARRREIATRLAVGAGRGQLLRQLLVEALVLYLLAAGVGVILSFWLVAFLDSFMPALPLPVAIDPTVDVRLLGFALSVALTTAVVFGLVPAARSTRLDIVTALHGQHGTAGRGRSRLRHSLVAAQVALALVLLVTTGLFLRALHEAASADTGYDGAGVHVFTVDLSLGGHSGQAAVPVASRLLERVAAIGGIDAVASSRMIPLQGGGLGLGRLRVPGYRDEDGGDRFTADWDVVSPGYFALLRVPIVSGRGFSADDRLGRPFVAVVNETFAARAWPGRDPIGQVLYQALQPGSEERPLTVVGVARNARYRTIGEAPRAFIYVPFAQQPMTELHLYVRTAPGRQPAAEVASALAAVDANLPIVTSQTFAAAVGIGLLPQRVAASVAGGVGAVGLLLAALGLYGLMAFYVVQRTREMALRVALGASAGQVQRMVLRQAAGVGLAGGALGLLLASGAAAAVRELLVSVPPFDPAAFSGAALVLGSVLLIASWLPARRAAAQDPAAALRAE